MRKTKEKFPTLASIGSKFGFHRNTVTKWFSLPGAPKRGPKGFDVIEVSNWVKLCAEKEASQAKTSPEMAAAKLSEVLQRVRRITRENDVEDRKLIPLNYLEHEVRSMADAAQRVLSQLPDRGAMDLAGLKPHEIHTRLQSMIDESLLAMAAGGSREAEKWARDEMASRKLNQPHREPLEFSDPTEACECHHYSERLKALHASLRKEHIAQLEKFAKGLEISERLKNQNTPANDE